MSHSNRATTDGAGLFVFERVAAGAGYLQRERKSGGVAPWPPELLVPAGQTVHPTLGVGRAVKGRVFADRGAVDWRDFRMQLHAHIGGSWKTKGPGAPIPPPVECELDRKGNFALKNVIPGMYRIDLPPAVAGAAVAIGAGRLTVPVAPDPPADAPHDAGEVSVHLPAPRKE